LHINLLWQTVKLWRALYIFFLFLRSHRMHEVQTVANDVPVTWCVCQSHACNLQKWLNGSSSCLGGRFLGLDVMWVLMPHGEVHMIRCRNRQISSSTFLSYLISFRLMSSFYGDYSIKARNRTRNMMCVLRFVDAFVFSFFVPFGVAICQIFSIINWQYSSTCMGINKRPKSFGKGCTVWPRAHGMQRSLHAPPAI